MRAWQAREGQRLQRCCVPKGGILFPKRIPPLNPPEKGEGSPPRPPTLAVSILKSCAACGIRCGVHGFAMNPCESLPVATAPYCREARVTFAWRQTACGMRHCCARRIVETGGRRELLRTSPRWAERQRIIGAEANRIAALNAATPRAGSRIPEAQRSFKLWTANLSLSLGVPKGPFSFAKENGPFDSLPHSVGNNDAALSRCDKNPAARGGRKKRQPFGCRFFQSTVRMKDVDPF